VTSARAHQNNCKDCKSTSTKSTFLSYKWSSTQRNKSSSWNSSAIT
jgi:hypothetical protein